MMKRSDSAGWWFQLGSWALAVTGVGHLGVVAALTYVLPADPVDVEVFKMMAARTVTFMGVGRNHLQLSQGFSVLMGLFALGMGATNVVWARGSAVSLSQLRTVSLLTVAISAAVLVVVFRDMPPPPMITMSMAVASFGVTVVLSTRGMRFV